jgi:glycosyltransferase involved in cell wall biosynthesis
MTKIRISIITPFYKGNAYMSSYRAMIRRNAETLQKSDLKDQMEFEVLLVNDSPDENVLLCDDFPSVQLIQNPVNLGIQRSRIHGLREASGSYILFLDQDDILADNAILSFGRALLEKADSDKPYIYVANAVLEQKDWKSLWYRTDYHKRQVGNKQAYLNIGTMIVSPGQCLIPKEWIPDFWIQHPLKENGSDDYFLWILLLEAGVEFRYLDKALYIHHYTSKNLSGDTRQTDQSTFEFVEVLQTELEAWKNDSYPIGKDLSISVKQTLHDMNTLRRMMKFKADFRQGGRMEKIRQIFCHPCLFLRNVSFKIRSRTGYGFNR